MNARETLRQEVSSFRAKVGDLAAQKILAEWGRGLTHSTRAGNNSQALRDSIHDPALGATAQLNRALIRTAHISALIYIAAEIVGQAKSRKLEILNQCLEFLLGVASSTRSCNLVPILP